MCSPQSEPYFYKGNLMQVDGTGDSPQFLQVITTVDKRTDAERISRLLVEGRLAACVQIIGPMTSVYRWQGKIETGEEWYCVAKTSVASYASVARAICEAHSYDVPEILAMPIVAGNPSYLEWLASELIPPDTDS